MFKADTRRYVCRDKYYGRRLDKAGVMETLYTFLHNGYRLRLELIQHILTRLRRLYHMISQQDTFRFYSSSLLIMYDGAELENISSPSSPQDEDDDDDEAVSEEESDVREDSGMEEEEEVGGACGMDYSDDSLDQSSHWQEFSVKTSKCHKCMHSKLVDVRMIDFAHVTHQGFRGDRTVHSGPDSGYLFGLKNLTGLFEDLLSEYSATQDTSPS